MAYRYSIIEEKEISNQYGRLLRVAWEGEDRNGRMQQHETELYEPGPAAAVLLYNTARKAVLLTRQFRLATIYAGGNEAHGGMLTEVCAGKLDDNTPEETVRKEAMEETGCQITEVQHVLTAYMSPGAFTERLHLYIAPYTPADKKGEGGGLAEEGENITPLEVPYEEAIAAIRHGAIIDAKTIILLQHLRLAGIM